MSYFVNAVTQHYADFQGRSRRTEFWMYVLFSFLISCAVTIVSILLRTTLGIGAFGIINLLIALALFLPGLAITIRRLHDIGYSGWFYLIVFIPLIGTIWLLVLLCLDSQPGTNTYGPNPKLTPIP